MHCCGRGSWPCPAQTDTLAAVLLTRLGRAIGLRRNVAIATFCCGVAVWVCAGVAEAAVAQTKGGGGQLALTVGFNPQGELVAASCQKSPCRLGAAATKLKFPTKLGARKKEVKLAIVGLEQGRQAVLVRLEAATADTSWQAVVAAPLGSGPPKIVFEGYTGWVEGVEGERGGAMLLISKQSKGTARSILVGEQREDLSLCGRPAILSPKLLRPRDLTLHPAKVQRLRSGERSAAPVLVAQRVAPEQGARAAPGLLRARAATSAVGNPEALTDGNPQTSWAENRSGSGRGEFVLLQAPSAVDLVGFEFVVRPPVEAESTDTDPAGAAPREFFLATNRELFKVKLDEDAWDTPGSRYRVTLPRPVKSDCVAVVLESAFEDTRDTRVTLSEFEAMTELGMVNVPRLMNELQKQGARAEAAKAQLRAIGPAAFEAIQADYSKLNESGRLAALEVVDAAACEVSVPVYAVAVRASASRPEQHHGKDRILRCGRKGTEALLTALKSGKLVDQVIILDQLAQVAPEVAVKHTVLRLARAPTEQRRQLRVILARASRFPSAQPVIAELLERPSFPEVGQIDLLRALGDQLPKFGGRAAASLDRLIRPDAPFRTRYLLLEPAAQLSRASRGASDFLRRALTRDQSPYVRMGAAEAIQQVQQFHKELVSALSDRQVRVRQAAAETLGRGRADFAAPALIDRLRLDPWPLVRTAAGLALSQLSPNTAIDRALGSALQDSSPQVRGAVVKAIGLRRVSRFAETLRDVLDDRDETGSVRSAAAEALGLLCDPESVDLLTQYAIKIADPLLSEELRPVAPTALLALARINPPDLQQRLEALTSPDAPEVARKAATRALNHRGGCQKARVASPPASK